MIAEKEKAAASTTANENTLHKESYWKAVRLSRLKGQVGLLLLTLQAQAKTEKQWHIFELKLRCYLDLKTCEVD